MTRSLQITILFFLALEGFSQTCCSGGVPVSSNLGFQSSEAGIIQLSLSADFNVLKTLKSGSDRLDDSDRLRTTQSYILRGAYAFDDRLTLEAFIPMVRQTRRITTNAGAFDKENTFGIGDPVALIIYDIIKKDVTLRLGAGPQIPLGSDDKTNSRGLMLLEDLQPGSGAWDLIIMGSLEYRLPRRPSSILYLNAITSRTGSNPNSRGGLQVYEFGNDIQLIGGYSDQVLVLNQIITPGLSMRYRHAERDKVSQNELPGTGGKFLFGRISNCIQFQKLKSSFNLNFEFPLWSQVNETQLAPSYIINIGWFKRFGLNKEDADLINLD